MFKKGDRVTYEALHGAKENGVVKSITEDGKHAFVVFHWDIRWEDYEKFTGARVPLDRITIGWMQPREEIIYERVPGE